MNIKKLFGRSNRDRDEDDALERYRKLMDSLPKMRQQHYLFAHRLLPSAMHQMGAISILLLSDSENSARFLHEVWSDSGENQTGYDLVTPDGLSVSVNQSNDKLLAVVTLPPALAVPEAYFVAVLSDVPPEINEDDAEVLESEEAQNVLRLMLRSMPIRYFTLEKGVELDGSARTVFCEWTSEGSHLNMGEGPAPDARAFFEFVTAQDFSLVADEN